MRHRLWLLSWALLIIGALCIAQEERVSAFWQSRDSNYNVNITGAAAGYSGPGDVVGSAFVFYSSARAYNAAYANGTNPLADIVDTATGLAACTIQVKTNGFADLTSAVCPTGSPTVGVTTFCTVTHAAGCSVTKIYDQTGNGFHLTQATLADMPVLSLSALNSLPCLLGNGSSTFLDNAVVTGAPAQPFSFSAVGKRTANFTSQQSYFGTNNVTGVLAGWASSANTLQYYASTAVTNATATDNAFHAMQTAFNGASSFIYVDGTLTNANTSPGSTGLGSHFILLNDIYNLFLSGPVCEMGVWSVAFTSGNYTGLNSNQHGTNGYNF